MRRLVENNQVGLYILPVDENVTTVRLLLRTVPGM